MQGEVEQIAMMKPKASAPHEEGLLEYLEDIIGSNRFVAQIEELGKKLEELNEQRVEKVNRLKLAEKERDNLSDSKETAQEYMDKEKEIRRQRNVLYQVYGSVERNNLAALTERKEKLDEMIAKERSKLSENEKKMSEMQACFDETSTAYNAVGAELQKTTEQFAAYERRDVKLQEDMKHCKEQIKKLQTSISKDAKLEEECTKKADQTLSQIEIARKSLSEIAAKKADEEANVDEILQSMQQATKGLREQLESARVDLAEAERGVASLNTEKESLVTRMQLLQGRAAAAAKNMGATEDKIAKLVSERAATEAKISGQAEEKRSLEAQIAAVTAQIRDKEAEEIRIQDSLRNAVRNVEEAKVMFKQQQNGSKNPVINGILKAARKGGPLESAGVRGRLGNLGSISPEYDVAISTACGTLDHIVVDTAEGGQACLNYLRETNLGRASFIVLDQIGQAREAMTRPVKSPVPRLFDLVTPVDEAFRPAFYLALKDTLVAPDFATAIKVAYEGNKAVWRVVSMDGNMVEMSGAMSGGGTQVKSGAMNIQQAAGGSAKSASSRGGSSSSSSSSVSRNEEITPSQIQSLEASVTKLQSDLSACRTAKAEAEITLKELTKRLAGFSTEVAKMEMALGSYDEKIADLSERVRSLKSETDLSASEKAELRTLEGKIADIDAEILRVSPNLQSLRNTASSIQKRILEFGGPKLQNAQKKLEALTAQAEALSSVLSTREVDESNNRKQATKANAARVKGEQEMTKLSEKIKKLEAEQAEMENEAALVIEAVKDAEARMQEQDEQLKLITKQYNEMKKEIGNLKKVEIDLTEEADKTKKDIKEREKAITHWAAELESVRKQHLDEQRELKASVRAALEATVLPSLENGANNGNTVDVVSALDAEEIEALVVLEEEHLEKAKDDVDEIKREIAKLEAARDKMKKDLNMGALLEYLKKDAQYKIRLYDLEAITEVRNATRRSYEDLRRQRLEEFMAGFGSITLKLKEMYQMITLGGDAELELVDSLDPFSEGIVFSVRPPKKSWKNISNLSGGEKTLSSLALVFALHHFKPTPLYVMDEIDAALDFKNVSIVANYIKERTKNAQFVIISLRNNMFELADRLVGIYKTNDTTKSVTINPKAFVQNATAMPPAPPATRVALGDATNKV